MPGASQWTRQAPACARAGSLLLCLALAFGGDGQHATELAVTLATLAALGIVAELPALSPTGQRLVVLLEAAAWSGGVLNSGADSSPLLPYLIGPALAGGLRLGLEGVLLAVGWAGISVTALLPTLDQPQRFRDVLGATGEWLVLALLVGLLGAWVRALQHRESGADGYQVAYRLLDELRDVTRRLPVGLDRNAVADRLVREAVDLTAGATGADVLIRGRDASLVRLTSGPGGDDLPQHSTCRRAWTTQKPTYGDGVLALPLATPDHSSGLLALAVASEPERATVSLLEDLAREGALRLETSALFEELREVATVEERRRLAREIHDGVAQDLAAFGYQLDDLAHQARGTEGGLADRLLEVRSELSGLIGELRHSIFELRSDMIDHASLGAALADYAHAVGRSTGLTVHLLVEETADRLPADTEAELLRIAQEAITNSRRHAQATNLWIGCQVDPPSARLVIEDDGAGIPAGREGQFGLAIMRERAARLQAELSVEMRSPQGTVVTCTLGQR